MPKREETRRPKRRTQSSAKKGSLAHRTAPGIVLHLAPPRRQGGPGRPFLAGNIWAWKPGQPSSNPGGRPRVLSESYAKLLGLPIPDDSYGRNVSEVLAEAMVNAAIAGNVAAASEIRRCTEGDKVHLSLEAQLEESLADALREGRLTSEAVIAELGREAAERILKRAGVEWPGGVEKEADNG